MFKAITRLAYVISLALVTLTISGCSTQETPKKDSSNRQALYLKTRNTELSNEKTIESIWKAYCNIHKIVALYSIAPDQNHYNLTTEHNSGIPFQKTIAPKLLAERSILGQEALLTELTASSEGYKHTISLIKESDAYLLKFFHNMQGVKHSEDFQSNMLSNYVMSVNLLQSIPQEFAKEHQLYGNQQSGNEILLLKSDKNGTLCENEISVTYWSTYLTPINTNLKELEYKEILQDINFRKTPGVNGDIIKPIIRGEYVYILNKMIVGSMTWYQIKQNDTEGWISELAFINDPSKASASNCDLINGYIHDDYCGCNEGYQWDRKSISCKPTSIINFSDRKPLTQSISIDKPLSVEALSISPTLVDLPTTNSNLVPVNSYVKSDGTYVESHYRTAPNSTILDNLSY
ncbi:MAG: hypothetical protein U0518_01310 [Candidatus Gracilibacteria bacterium]